MEGVLRVTLKVAWYAAEKVSECSLILSMSEVMCVSLGFSHRNTLNISVGCIYEVKENLEKGVKCLYKDGTAKYGQRCGIGNTRSENIRNAGQRARLKLMCFALAVRVNLLFISEGQSSSRKSIDYGSFESEQGEEQGRIGLCLSWFS